MTSTVIIDGVRAYYAEFVRQVAAEKPSAQLPAFDDFTGEQLRTWTLAYASVVEVSARMAKAVSTLNLDGS